jgi:hypothetical protein
MTGGGTTASSTKVVETGAGLVAVDEVPAPFGSRMIGSTGGKEGLAMAEVTAYPSANPAKLAAITAYNRRVRSTTHRMVRRGRNQDEMRMRIPSSSLAMFRGDEGILISSSGRFNLGGRRFGR